MNANVMKEEHYVKFDQCSMDVHAKIILMNRR